MSKIEELIERLCPNGVEYKKLDEVCNFNRGTSMTSKNAIEGDVPVISGGQKPAFYHNASNRPAGTITIAGSGAYAGYVAFWDKPIFCADSFSVDVKDDKILDKKFLCYYLLNKQQDIYNKKTGAGIAHVHGKDIAKFKIPVPPLEVQCEIVHILDDFTLLSAELSAELKARKRQYEYYKNKIFNNKNVKYMRLEEIGQVKMCKRILKKQTNSISGIPFYKIGTFGKEPDAYISEETYKDYLKKYNHPKKGDILISCAGTIGRTVVYDGKPAYFQDSNIVWLEHDESIVLNKYLLYSYSLNPWNISNGGTIARLYNDNILKAVIPVPTIEDQIKIIKVLDNFDKICNSLMDGLPAEIEARQKQYEYYRDKLLTFKELKVNE